MSTDRIEKSIVLRAPLDKVWQAIADYKQFGSWFGVRFDGPFVPGAALQGVVVPTTVNEEIARKQKSYEGLPFGIWVEALEPKTLFSFRWHPFAIEPGVDYSQEPTTLVTFVLSDTADGVLLTITESGFDQIPIERRAKAFAANDGGWTMQATMIRDYLAKLS